MDLGGRIPPGAPVTDLTEEQWLAGLAKTCACCPRCWDVPCPGCTQGGICDDMCRCDDGDGRGDDEAQSRDDLDAEDELP